MSQEKTKSSKKVPFSFSVPTARLDDSDMTTNFRRNKNNINRFDFSKLDIGECFKVYVMEHSRDKKQWTYYYGLERFKELPVRGCILLYSPGFIHFTTDTD